MKVRNVHERILEAPADDVGALLATLGTEADRLWPVDDWPPMRLHGPLQVGTVGGHGPIRYDVVEVRPGRQVTFRFRAPRGFHGTHTFDVTEVYPGRSRLRHVLEMEARGPALLSWPLVFRPLHDALLEDALDRAEAWVGMSRAPESQDPDRRRGRWSSYVRALRWLLRRLRLGRGGSPPSPVDRHTRTHGG